MELSCVLLEAFAILNPQGKGIEINAILVMRPWLKPTKAYP